MLINGLHSADLLLLDYFYIRMIHINIKATPEKPIWFKITYTLGEINQFPKHKISFQTTKQFSKYKSCS